MKEAAVKCKHNKASCVECGKTFDDTPHTTKGGRGVVGRLTNKKKQRPKK